MQAEKTGPGHGTDFNSFGGTGGPMLGDINHAGATQGPLRREGLALEKESRSTCPRFRVAGSMQHLLLLFRGDFDTVYADLSIVYKA